MWPQALDLTDKPHLVVGDFNSHNTLWGYSQTDNDGDAVEIWALSSDLMMPKMNLHSKVPDGKEVTTRTWYLHHQKLLRTLKSPPLDQYQNHNIVP